MADRPKDPSALLSLVYEELRAVAAALMRRERADHTIQPTALVHEAYFRLRKNTRIDWQGPTHFCAMAAREMRRALVDHARARRAQKRRGVHVSLHTSLGATGPDLLDVIAVDEAIEKLFKLNPRQGRVVELRFFGGLTTKETAEVLKVSERTVKQDWRFARAWMLRELSHSEESGER